MSFIRIGHIRAVAGVCVALVAMSVNALAQGISTTTVQGTVYLANGLPGAGTLQISWPAFTTASNQAVAAGKITASIGADGFVSVNLAPNLGSAPAGLYYTAVCQMSDGGTSTEFWAMETVAALAIWNIAWIAMSRTGSEPKVFWQHSAWCWLSWRSLLRLGTGIKVSAC